MKPTLLRIGTLVLSFAIGVAISLFFPNHHSDEAPPPAGGNRVSTKCTSSEDLNFKGENLAISVPNDDEFYIGKQKVELSQISARIKQLLGNVCFCDRVVFIKGASEVKFRTLDLIVRQAKEAHVSRIEFVLDKKKRGP